MSLSNVSNLTLYSIDTHFNASTDSFENIEGKEEIARNEQFLLFPQCFFTQSENCIPIFQYFDITSLFAADLEEPKTGISSKWIKQISRRRLRKFFGMVCKRGPKFQLPVH